MPPNTEISRVIVLVLLYAALFMCEAQTSLPVSTNSSTFPTPFSIHALAQRRPRSRRLQEMNNLGLNAEPTPLYPGYGTHFSYIYIGTPPQRQSVIIDTGSRLTAFPCTGCQQCGKHTDEYFNWKNSSSAKVHDCRGKPCVISQSYSEGSSWKAFKISDVMYIGGISSDTVANANMYRVDFVFGCQTYETGLFRTQLADGIMGMSMSEDTLPYVLHSKGITKTKMFALCFRVGGGILTLGGVDEKIHGKSDVVYAKLLKKSGWFTVHLLDIQFEAGDGGKLYNIGSSSEDNFNRGKGVIVDSGTTDTYLPMQLAARFKKLFFEISNTQYSNNNIALSSDQLTKLPNIVYTFEGVDGKKITVIQRWNSYVESVGPGKYAFRVYLTEPQGIVLGANFMNNHNVIFDPEGGKVGFAKSNCKYEHFYGKKGEEGASSG